jgi:hypothetical protein
MKTLLFILFGLWVGQNGFSQMSLNSVKNGNYGTPQERAQQQTDDMSKGLQLTTEQRAKVHLLNVKYAEQTEREVVKTELGAWSKYRKIMSIQSAKDKELQPILTADQFKKYQKRRDELIWEGAKAMLW